MSVEMTWAWRVCFQNQNPISRLALGTTRKGREPSQIEGEPIRWGHLHNRASQSSCWYLHSPSAPFRAGLPPPSDGGRVPDAPSPCPFDTFIRMVLEAKLHLLSASCEW